jgi:zinc protease
MTTTHAPDLLDRSRPPAPGVPKDVTFPEYFEDRLTNGLKVIVYERRDLPMVTVNLVARAGGFYDGTAPGLATMTAELLTKGTPTRNAVQIVEDIESLGGSIGANAGWDSSSAGVTILSRNLERAMDVLAEVARTPTFPLEEVERARDQRLAHIMQRKASPNALAANQFQRALYGSHPYGNPLEGSEASIAALAPGLFAEHHRRVFCPNNMFILAVGDIAPDAMMRMAEKLFGDWQPVHTDWPQLAVPVAERGRLVQVVDRPNAVQSSILVGHVGIERKHPAYITVTLMNTLFGGYFGSRLNLNLRENKGFTYGAHSRFDGRMQAGPFSAGADVRNEVTDAAIEEIILELERIRSTPVGEEELSNVKSYVTGNFPIQIETPLQVAQRIITLEMFGLEKTYYNTYNSRVMAITADDIQAAAQEWLHPDRLAIVAAGRGALLRDTLSRFGQVEVFTADGDPILIDETTPDTP